MKNYQLIKNTNPNFTVIYDVKPDLYEVLTFHTNLPEYKITPLYSLSCLAKKMNVKQIYVKDESYRFNLNSFKALGVSYAASKIKQHYSKIICCTDGNHGKALAWYAKQTGKKAIIYMPKNAEQKRIESIQALGGEVIVTNLNYDDTVLLAKEEAIIQQACFIQDTAFGDYLEIPADIMKGYTTIIQEAYAQMELKPTHIFLQAGVGSFAAGALLAISQLQEEKPYIGIVESSVCSCIYESFKQKKMVCIQGDLDTIMAGLNCGNPSILALPIIEKYSDWLIQCDDVITEIGMQIGKHPVGHDTSFSAGESGAVTLGLLYETALSKTRNEFHLDDNSVIFIINTEGRVNDNEKKRP